MRAGSAGRRSRAWANPWNRTDRWASGLDIWHQVDSPPLIRMWRAKGTTRPRRMSMAFGRSVGTLVVPRDRSPASGRMVDELSTVPALAPLVSASPRGWRDRSRAEHVGLVLILFYPTVVQRIAGDARVDHATLPRALREHGAPLRSRLFGLLPPLHVEPASRGCRAPRARRRHRQPARVPLDSREVPGRADPQVRLPLRPGRTEHHDHPVEQHCTGRRRQPEAQRPAALVDIR